MDYSFLTNTPLFLGTSSKEAEAILSCLCSYVKQYDKGGVILRAGECPESMGMVLSGGVNIELDDLWGNMTILGHVEAGGLFAETYACLPGEPLMVSAVASETSTVLFLNAARLLTSCTSSCAHHNTVIRNLLQITAQKNLALSRRSLHTAPKTIRGRLLSYLSEQSRLHGSCHFSIPFDRQQLADYLGVDRSALSNELSKMRQDGILTYDRSRFVIKEGRSIL